MKLDREFYETNEYKGKKWYHYQAISDDVGAYADPYNEYYVVFELATDEHIGTIGISDNRTSWKDYYNSTCLYGWDGRKSTKKDHYKTLCTRATYSTALGMLMDEYKRRKA